MEYQCEGTCFVSEYTSLARQYGFSLSAVVVSRHQSGQHLLVTAQQEECGNWLALRQELPESHNGLNIEYCLRDTQRVNF
jgi:hypothetical protein